jgi:arsenate reductase-like glutaredoxin family protein
VPASRKLQRDDALKLLKNANKLTVAKGKKVVEFSGKDKTSDEAVSAMLGSTGNLRAPTAVVGKDLLVGFNEDAYQVVFS